MYHTFVGCGSPSDGHPPLSRKSQKRSNLSSQACDLCRKRKIRCDGNKPCRPCSLRSNSDDCSYSVSKRAKSGNNEGRVKTAQTDAATSGVTPAATREDSHRRLSLLTKDELIDLCQRHAEHGPRSDSGFGVPDDGQALQQLQPFPEERSNASDGVDAEEAGPGASSATPGITDDVNGLSLWLRPSSTYLGISSVMAILRVISSLDPHYRTITCAPALAAQDHNGIHPKTLQDSCHPMRPTPSAFKSSLWSEVPFINAFFEHIHPMIPILDEARFRDVYAEGRRVDSRWGLLLNTVLTIGAVAATDADDDTHLTYYTRAREHLTLDMLSDAHMETVQALTVLGGLYLHYINRPSLANSLLGAAFRMATSIGLHRDYSENTQYAAVSDDMQNAIEIRRRVWWALVMVDSWCTIFSGRPTHGRAGPGHTTAKPVQPVRDRPEITQLLRECIELCLITTEVEDSLVQRSILTADKSQLLDNALQAWLRDSCVERSNMALNNDKHTRGIVVAMNVARWRCITSRIVVLRPFLLWAALSRLPMAALPAERQSAIRTCRELAGQLITDISETWQTPSQCQVSGWIATWLLYQAVMVPLLSLYSDFDQASVLQESLRQIDMTKQTMALLEKWSPTAKRSLEVVKALCDAGQSHASSKLSGHATNGEISLDTRLNDAGSRPHVQELVFESPASLGPLAVGGNFFVDSFFAEDGWGDLQDLESFL